MLLVAIYASATGHYGIGVFFGWWAGMGTAIELERLDASS
jgi:hypothetical protein